MNYGHKNHNDNIIGLSISPCVMEGDIDVAVERRKESKKSIERG
jgi:hypothetical protein